MVLFVTLLLTLLILAVIVVTVVATAGAGFIVIFGDVIVCIVFIVLIMKYLIKRKRK